MIHDHYITTIAEHSVALDFLPEKANILDLGCRGFIFTNEMKRLGHHVYAVDIDVLCEQEYYHFAIAGSDGRCGVRRSKDPQATCIMEGSEISKHTIKSFSEMVGVKFWDLIKMDIEGSEYEVIMSLNEPPAKQLSIEFHLHTGTTAYQMVDMEVQLRKLGYFTMRHELTHQHGLCANYWDSLFLLKDGHN